MMNIKCVIVLLISVFALGVSSCKKENYTPQGNWQLTGFNQVIYSSNSMGKIDTAEYTMSNGIVNYKYNAQDINSYGLLLQLNLADNGSATLTQANSPIGLSSSTTVYTGTWNYEKGVPKSKIDFAGLSQSHMYNKTYPFGVAYFTIENLTSNELTIMYHYRVFTSSPFSLDENGCTMRFTKL